MRRKSKLSRWRNQVHSPLGLLVMLLTVVALMGGSSRPDVLSLVVLRPATVALAIVAVFALRTEGPGWFTDWSILVALALLLTLSHLLPLPPSVWQQLPGRELIVAIDAAAGFQSLWRPLSLDPTMTRNAFWALAVPVGAFALAIRLDEQGRERLLRTVLLIGLISGLLGVLQYASGPSGPYFYRITNFGTAVGLFANRNHNGVFLATLIPLLCAYVATGPSYDTAAKSRRTIAVAAAALAVPMILSTGSRAGLVAAAIGFLAAAVLARRLPRSGTAPRRQKQVPWKRWLVPIGAVAFAAFCVVFIGLLQGNSVDRLLGGEEGQPEMRLHFWTITARAAADYFPFGSGVGSFVRVYQIHEPAEILSLRYANHAHNDFVEIWLDSGIFGAGLIGAALILLARDGWRVWRSLSRAPEMVLARAASVGLALVIVASVVDYPLRTPLFAAIAVIYVVWLRRGALAAAARRA